MIRPEKLAKLWHDTYEEVIEENQGSKWVPSGSRAWDDIPTMSRRLLTEVCRRVLAQLDEEDITPRRWK